MARELTAQLKFSEQWVYTSTQTGAGTSENNPRAAAAESIIQEFANGVGADQAQRLWQSEGRVLAAAASETIDLYDFGALDIGGGAGKDQLGQALALSGIKGLVIWNLGTDPSPGNLIIGGEGSAAAWNSLFNGSDTATQVIQPGGLFVFIAPTAAGYAVADATNHLFKLAADGGDVTYNIRVYGI